MKKLNIIKSLAHKKWDADLRIHQMIILPTSSPTTLKTPDPVHHKGVRLALGNFAVCRTENVLHEAGISTLVKIREQDTSRIAIRVITNKSHPIRSYFMNNKIHDK
jgi:hypothetical protein